MLIINFSHPLNAEQRTDIESLTGEPTEEIREVPVYFDHDRPFIEQTKTLVDEVGLSAKEWQTTPLLVNPPSLHIISALVLAELHGRMGYFPALLRLRPVVDAIPPKFEVAEIIDLQRIRDQARARR